MNGKQSRALRKIAEANTDGDHLRAKFATKTIKKAFKEFKRGDNASRGKK